MPDPCDSAIGGQQGQWSQMIYRWIIQKSLWLFNSSPWKITMLLIGKPSINGPFSMAMLNKQMV
jgi:hypothetical protein